MRPRQIALTNALSLAALLIPLSLALNGSLTESHYAANSQYPIPPNSTERRAIAEKVDFLHITNYLRVAGATVAAEEWPYHVPRQEMQKIVCVSRRPR